MDLKEIAAVSGKPGLYRVVKPTRNGVILEALDKKKGKLIANANNRISILKEISIYTHTEEGSVLLEEVYNSMNDEYGKELPVSNKSTEEELFNFLEEVVPDYNRERVYHSDVKKLVSWYDLLQNNIPEIFNQENPKEKEAGDENPSSDKKEDKPAIKKESKSSK